MVKLSLTMEISFEEQDLIFLKNIVKLFLVDSCRLRALVAEEVVDCCCCCILWPLMVDYVALCYGLGITVVVLFAGYAFAYSWWWVSAYQE